MPFAAGEIKFTGTIGDISAYRMRGVDRIVLRSKGGVPGKRIKTHPNYELTRRNNEEWKGCIIAGKAIRAAIYKIKHLADFNFSGPLHALCKNIQLDDTVNEKGKRPVLLSQANYKLEGFGLNRSNSFESIMRHPLQYFVDRTGGFATISLPDIVPGINFYNPFRQPFYRFIFMLSVLTDIVYDANKKSYQPVKTDIPFPAVVQTAWHGSYKIKPSEEITISINNWHDEPGISLLLSAGVEFGVPAANAVVNTVKYAGAGKLLKMA